MTAVEILQQSKDFADELVKQLSNKSLELGKRQVYFMDNHAKIQACMSALHTVVDTIKDAQAVDDSDLQAMNDANAMLNTLQGAITAFQSELMVTETVEEDDLVKVPGLTSDALQDASMNNETTKSIVKDMNDIVKNQQAVAYTHCLVCDGTMNMFAAGTTDELNKNINNIAAAGNFKDIQLYEVRFKPVPLKKKTILSV